MHLAGGAMTIADTLAKRSSTSLHIFSLFESDERVNVQFTWKHRRSGPFQLWYRVGVCVGVARNRVAGCANQRWPACRIDRDNAIAKYTSTYAALGFKTSYGARSNE